MARCAPVGPSGVPTSGGPRCTTAATFTPAGLLVVVLDLTDRVRQVLAPGREHVDEVHREPRSALERHRASPHRSRPPSSTAGCTSKLHPHVGISNKMKDRCSRSLRSLA